MNNYIVSYVPCSLEEIMNLIKNPDRIIKIKAKKKPKKRIIQVNNIRVPVIHTIDLSTLIFN